MKITEEFTAIIYGENRGSNPVHGTGKGERYWNKGKTTDDFMGCVPNEGP